MTLPDDPRSVKTPDAWLRAAAARLLPVKGHARVAASAR